MKRYEGQAFLDRVLSDFFVGGLGVHCPECQCQGFDIHHVRTGLATEQELEVGNESVLLRAGSGNRGDHWLEVVFDCSGCGNRSALVLESDKGFVSMHFEREEDARFHELP